jgi:serine/threonine protein kinase
MPLKHISCGQPVNRSEQLAIERAKSLLGSVAGDWVLLSNLALITSQDRQPDDLDMVLIGPCGVLLTEVKHWDATWVAANEPKAMDEARKLCDKAKRLGSLVRKTLNINVWVDQVFLLTREPVGTGLKEKLGGAAVWTLKSLPGEIKKLPTTGLDARQVAALAQALEPRTRLQLDGKVRRIADYQNLELSSPPQQSFHRIYRGVHRRTLEKVVVHVYDLSASDEKDPYRMAEREFKALQVLQKCRYVARMRDSFQELAEYPGEVWMYSVFDISAPSVEKRSNDAGWTLPERMEFAQHAFAALHEIHGITDEQSACIIHRQLSPAHLLVGARNRPVITGFELARLPDTQTIAGALPANLEGDWLAPEIRAGGLAAATAASDVYALCQVLCGLFPLETHLLEVLHQGMADVPAARASLDALASAWQKLLKPAAAPSEAERQPIASPPRAEFWCEGTEIPFGNRTLRVVASLGSGGVGRTFKVEEIDPATGENFGTFVAKVIFSAEAGRAALNAYRRVRSHSDQTGLATVFQVAEEWKADHVVALLKWVPEESLHGLRDGLVGLAMSECNAANIEALLRQWLQSGCQALAALHSQNLVHGDVSAKNLIYRPGTLTLTDFDLVTQVGTASWGVGAVAYASPEAEKQQPLHPSDDVFALAASVFSVAFGRESPFTQQDGAMDKARGLNWLPGDRENAGSLAVFFDQATARDRSFRFRDALAALDCLQDQTSSVAEEAATYTTDIVTPQVTCRTEQTVPWLDSLLSVYPGSPHGNIETRGLDSAFALATYVPTKLEEELIRDLRERKVRLIILCGNAGDGKTALLQRLAASFGVDHAQSSTRIWELKTADGLTLKANLDGSAAWQGQSADKLLNELLEPFMNGVPDDDRAHLLAINDGRLMQWLDDKTGRAGALLNALSTFLSHDEEERDLPAHFRFISLNHRSLVGGQEGDEQEIKAPFLEQLIDVLLGGSDAAVKWSVCRQCSAWDRCIAGPTAHRLLASPNTQEGQRGLRLRQRLGDALQAVHQRGSVHITARELRGTLSYLLFGIRSCTELHQHPELDSQQPTSLERLGDMAFDPQSPCRQGDLLRELAELDPALEAHPHLDRWLLGNSGREGKGAGPTYPGHSLASARRRAYFEWLPEEIEALTGNAAGLGLAGGEYLADFRAASVRSADQNSDLCQKICRGISHLEDLPALALIREGYVPLRIPSRTDTESKFWIEQPLSRFRLEPELPSVRDPAITLLPRRLRLVFACEDGREEALPLGYTLFATLLRLADGEQLSETRSDDLFANLQIFTQRLAQEDNRTMLAWNPKEDDKLHRLSLQHRAGIQSLVLEALLLTEP